MTEETTATESKTMRAVRYMNMLNGHRDTLRENVRSYRDPNDAARSNQSCDNIIDGAIGQVAKSTISTGTDFETADDLCHSIELAIQKQFEQKPDRGYALGE